MSRPNDKNKVQKKFSNSKEMQDENIMLGHGFDFRSRTQLLVFCRVYVR